MFTSATIENFRGIERLTVEGLGRVNLIIGKNNSGKTALMEALWALECEEAAAEALSLGQAQRMPDGEEEDFEGFWKPLFRGEDAERGFTVQAKRTDRTELQLNMYQPHGSGSHAVPLASGGRRSGQWALTYEIQKQGKQVQFNVTGRAKEVTYPVGSGQGMQAAWFSTGFPRHQEVISALSKLKQQGRDNEVRDLLRWLDKRIDGLEILSPTGSRAAIFVRVSGEPKMLPLEVMGEGVQRCLVIATALAAEEFSLAAVDEIENGLHYSVLGAVWKWLAAVSANRRIQVFATTHSEECVQAASQAFTELGDNGLKVIRLDRQEHETVAKVYDRDLVAAAERMDIEIRG
jgi:predicted ATPase